MVKRVFQQLRATSLLYVMFISLMGLLVLSACAQTETVGSNSAPAEEAVESNVETASNETSAQRDLTDLSLVANTGRPQFLNAFATW